MKNMEMLKNVRIIWNLI